MQTDDLQFIFDQIFDISDDIRHLVLSRAILDQTLNKAYEYSKLDLEKCNGKQMKCLRFSVEYLINQIRAGSLTFVWRCIVAAPQFVNLALFYPYDQLRTRNMIQELIDGLKNGSESTMFHFLLENLAMPSLETEKFLGYIYAKYKYTENNELMHDFFPHPIYAKVCKNVGDRPHPIDTDWTYDRQIIIHNIRNNYQIERSGCTSCRVAPHYHRGVTFAAILEADDLELYKMYTEYRVKTRAKYWADYPSSRQSQLALRYTDTYAYTIEYFAPKLLFFKPTKIAKYIGMMPSLNDYFTLITQLLSNGYDFSWAFLVGFRFDNARFLKSALKCQNSMFIDLFFKHYPNFLSMNTSSLPKPTCEGLSKRLERLRIRQDMKNLNDYLVKLSFT